MRLSAAIRAGARLHPQTFSRVRGVERRQDWLGWILRREVYATSAWGAAIEAAQIGHIRVPANEVSGIRGPVTDHVGPDGCVECLDLPADWLTTCAVVAACPACRSYTAYVGLLITHLNDDHHWSREDVARFVAAQEPQVAEVPADYHRSLHLRERVEAPSSD